MKPIYVKNSYVFFQDVDSSQAVILTQPGFISNRKRTKFALEKSIAL